jgi:Molybdopterin-binding domain of aldehyde dehydrogenase
MLRFIESPSRARRRISGVKLGTPVIRKASPSVRIGGVTGVPMELRAALGVYDEIAGRFTVYASAGGGVIWRREDIAGALGVPKDAVRVVSGDVGGNLGIRAAERDGRRLSRQDRG